MTSETIAAAWAATALLSLLIFAAIYFCRKEGPWELDWRDKAFKTGLALMFWPAAGLMIGAALPFLLVAGVNEIVTRRPEPA